MAILYPSLISADVLNLASVLKRLDSCVSGYHIDIMDFNFVPNLTWGPPIVNAIAQATTKQLWVHLMVNNPKGMIKALDLRPDSIVSFHIESYSENKTIINDIQEKRYLPSIAISPKTPVEEILPFLSTIYQVLVMSVEPGFSGQLFLPETISKVDTLVQYKKNHNLNFRIGMDGGINKKNINNLITHGVDDIAIAHAIFGSPDYVQALHNLMRELNY